MRVRPIDRRMTDLCQDIQMGTGWPHGQCKMRHPLFPHWERHPPPSFCTATYGHFTAVSKCHMSHTVFILRAIRYTHFRRDRLYGPPHKSHSFGSNEIITYYTLNSVLMNSWIELCNLPMEKERFVFITTGKVYLESSILKETARICLENLENVHHPEVTNGWKSIVINVLDA